MKPSLKKLLISQGFSTDRKMIKQFKENAPDPITQIVIIAHKQDTETEADNYLEYAIDQLRRAKRLFNTEK